MSFYKRIVYKSLSESDELTRFISDPDSFIQDGEILKDGDTTTVAKITIDGHSFVLKRYNRVGYWRSLRRLFSISKAQRSLRNAAVLERLGICTPKPYLLLEETQFRVSVRRAYLVTDYVEADNLLAHLQQPYSFNLDRQLVNGFSHFFNVMKASKISHGDMKASNSIYRKGKLWVLDLDSMKQHKFEFLFQLRFKKDAVRFMRNWCDGHLGTLFRPIVDRLQHRTTTE